MAVETELKLHISPEHMARLRRHPFLRSLSSGRSVTRKLYSVYYDTPELYLHKHAMALRLRRVGRQWLQTLKGGGAVQAGLHQRNEWESAVTGEALDFSALEACGAMHLPKHVRKELQAVFVTDFSRTSRMVDFAGTRIEVSMDSGKIRAGRRVHGISELELELKEGNPLQLFRLALALLDIVPLQIEMVSKAEYGYRLWKQMPVTVARASIPQVNERSHVAAVLQAMIWSCLLPLQANVAGAVRKLDDEYLHQIRVALRRLRVALSLASGVLEDIELGELRNNIAALGVELGRAREWDVFVTQTLKPLRHQLEIEPVVRDSERERSRQHDRVRQVLQAQDLQRLLLRFGVWMLGSYWREGCWNDAPAAQMPGLRQFAAVTLHKRSKQVRKQCALLSPRADTAMRPEPEQLHRLRIACKKLRYCLELFATLYEGKKVKRYLDGLTQMQDTLGQLNDIAVARRLLEQLGSGTHYDASMLIRGWVENDYARQMTQLHKAWQKLSGHDEFWM